ncbi:MerR family transcriptional regulator [Namhaeicola litoreus]|uniref:MerR family transcriptional regulator n=1 Tax=Namhaeicola litoreus TaxID=1052145 RepID=A0ABW3XYT2_9FLAO
MSIKTTYSIKDLEHLSGIKAHTIRIWERRYNLFEPNRTDTNIRTYDQKTLQKLLNVVLLLENGYKISKISEIKESDLYSITRELQLKKHSSTYALDTLKLAMLNFDRVLFEQVYNQLLEKHDFREIFVNYFIPFLNEIGMLWVTKTISPAHEHFISNLIKQKLLTNIERVQHMPSQQKATWVLFLPLNEIHELGLMYIHFELLLKGYNSIYLGMSTPIENLLDLQSVYDDITFVSYFTVEPTEDKIQNYLAHLNEFILEPRNEKLHILGKNSEFISDKALNTSMIKHKTLKHFLEVIE